MHAHKDNRFFFEIAVNVKWRWDESSHVIMFILRVFSGKSKTSFRWVYTGSLGVVSVFPVGVTASIWSIMAVTNKLLEINEQKTYHAFITD